MSQLLFYFILFFFETAKVHFLFICIRKQTKQMLPPLYGHVTRDSNDISVSIG